MCDLSVLVEQESHICNGLKHWLPGTSQCLWVRSLDTLWDFCLSVSQGCHEGGDWDCHLIWSLTGMDPLVRSHACQNSSPGDFKAKGVVVLLYAGISWKPCGVGSILHSGMFWFSLLFEILLVWLLTSLKPVRTGRERERASGWCNGI